MSELRIECFHRVLPRSQREEHWPYFVRGTAMTVEEFEHRLEVLGRDFEFVDESQATAILRGTRPASRACWITFDDGYRDNLEYAAPVLSRYGVRPSLFVTTRAIGSDWRPPVDRWYALLRGAGQSVAELRFHGVAERWNLTTHDGRLRAVTGRAKRAYLEASPHERHEHLARLADALGASPAVRPSLLSEEDLAELASQGWFVGPHGHEHRLLTRMSAEQVVDEVRRSVNALDRIPLEHRSRWFAYADGRYDADVVDTVRAMLAPTGFHGALTIDERSASERDDRWAVPRFIAN